MSPVPDSESETEDNKPTECESLSTPDLIIPPDPDSPEDDEEDDNNPYLGYIPLSQDPIDNNLADNEENTDGDNDNNVSSADAEQTEVAATGISNNNLHADLSKENIPPYLQVPDLPKPEKKNILWNQTRHEGDIQMGQEHVAKIKAAMAGFQLPTSNIPEWAREISDEELKEKLVSKVNVNCLNDTLDTDSNSTDSKNTGTTHSPKS